jgi:hypothetical protein
MPTPTSSSDYGSDFGSDFGTESVLRLIINGWSANRDGSLRYWYRYPDGVPGPQPPTP